MRRQDYIEHREAISDTLKEHVIVKPKIEYQSEEDKYVHKYVVPKTYESYLMSELQITLYPAEKKRSYTDFLNQEGLERFKDTKRRIQNEGFKDTFIEWGIDRSNSGLWIADTSSEFHDDDYGKVNLNSWKNLHIIGISKNNKQIMSTSTCVFIQDKKDDELGMWCLTYNNSLYKLENEPKYPHEITLKKETTL